MRIPYGVADFYSLRTEGEVYVDRTDRIATVEELGARVTAERRFRDHHRYRESDLAGLSEQAGLWVTTEKDAVKIEFVLQKLLPKKDWTFSSHALIWHGRRVCNARNPACDRCGLASDCPFPAQS